MRLKYLGLRDERLIGTNFWYCQPYFILLNLHYYEEFNRRGANLNSHTMAYSMSNLIDVVKSFVFGFGGGGTFEPTDPNVFLPYPYLNHDDDDEDVLLSRSTRVILNQLIKNKLIPEYIVKQIEETVKVKKQR